jgi:hypothetical protein
LCPALADIILAEIGKTDIFDGVKLTDYDEAVKSGEIVLVDTEVFEAFFENVKRFIVTNTVLISPGIRMTTTLSAAIARSSLPSSKKAA